MTTIQSLPKEVLITAFSFLDSIEYIGECRLVCKHWSDIAAVAMFEKPLHLCFYGKVKAKKLVQYLTRNQSKGQHVKHLSICHYDSNIVQTVLPLLFTPNIRELGGDDRDMLYECIARIAQESTVKFEKLKVIPSTDDFTDSYSQALWIFRNSLTNVYLTLEEIPKAPTHLINQLYRFQKLTKLTLKAPFDNVAELERIIGGCLQLQQLQLSTVAYVQYGDVPMDTATLSAWQVDNDNIHQVDSLKTLDIASAGFPHFVQYLMFKYPNMQSISLNIQETDAYITRSIEQLIDLLKMMQNYSLTYRITVGDDITTVFNAAKGNVNVVKIGYHHVLGGILTIVMTIEGREAQESTHETNFSMHIPPNVNTRTHVWYLSQIHVPINSLEIDLLNYRDFNVDHQNDLYRRISVKDETVVFFDILFDYPNIEHTRFIARDISNCVDFYFSQQCTWLKSLEICGAQLGPATSLALTDICRKLSVLKLINCPILRENYMARINMGHNTFEILTYQLMPCHYFTRNMDDSKNNAAVEYAEKTLSALELYYSRETYLWLRIKKTDQAIYLRIMPNDRYRYLITKKQFYLRPAKARAIQISCYTIKHLLLDLDSIYLQIDEEFIAYARTCPLASDCDSAEESDTSDY